MVLGKKVVKVRVILGDPLITSAHHDLLLSCCSLLETLILRSERLRTSEKEIHRKRGSKGLWVKNTGYLKNPIGKRKNRPIHLWSLRRVFFLTHSQRVSWYSLLSFAGLLWRFTLQCFGKETLLDQGSKSTAKVS